MSKPNIFNELRKASDRIGLPNANVTIDTVRQKKPYTMVVVNLNSSIEGIGFAKASPNDTWDSSIGFSIALFRAMRDAKHKYEARPQRRSMTPEQLEFDFEATA